MTRDADTTPQPRGPLCGIDAVYLACLLEGLPITYEVFLQPRYVSTANGSSIRDLHHAAADVGLNAVPRGLLSITDLMYPDVRAILHVTPAPGSSTFDHYVLLAGFYDNEFVTIDAGGIRKLTPAELAAIWDGNTLVVGEQQDRTLTSRALVRLALCVLAALLVIATLRFADRAVELHSARGRMLFGASALLFVACALGAGYHIVAPDGLLVSSTGVTAVRAANHRFFLPQWNIDRVKREVRSSETAARIVDARSREAFASGCIPGAMNVPATLPPEQVLALVSDQDRQRPIVVYCDNSRCSSAAQVAELLDKAGYQTVAIYPGGWQEWNERHRSD